MSASLLNAAKLESLLVAHWATFLDHRNLRSLIENELDNKRKITTISISRFEPTDREFIVWVEFLANGIQSTAELQLSPTGKVKNIRVAGL